MNSNYVSLIADLVLFCYVMRQNRDLLSLSDNNQATAIGAFNSTSSKYLDFLIFIILF